MSVLPQATLMLLLRLSPSRLLLLVLLVLVLCIVVVGGNGGVDGGVAAREPAQVRNANPAKAARIGCMPHRTAAVNENEIRPGTGRGGRNGTARNGTEVRRAS